MKSVIIDFDCDIKKWIVCESNGCHTDIIGEFDLFSMAIDWCESKGFIWSSL
jgi:hypothetical protein